MIGIMITHDESLFKYADRIIELYDGKIKTVKRGSRIE